MELQHAYFNFDANADQRRWQQAEDHPRVHRPSEFGNDSCQRRSHVQSFRLD
jgi:hypothetical protein